MEGIFYTYDMLIKLHQYLCEDNNEKFKKIFNENDVNMPFKGLEKNGKKNSFKKPLFANQPNS